jgi:hypothetical protein
MVGGAEDDTEPCAEAEVGFRAIRRRLFDTNCSSSWLFEDIHSG